MPVSEGKSINQSALLQQDLDAQVREVTDVVKVPGIEKLHLKSTEEIALVLANILKSRAGISRFTWDIKKGQLEITCDGNPYGQLRG